MPSDIQDDLTSNQIIVFQKLLESLNLSCSSVQFSCGTSVGENFFGCIIQAKVSQNYNVPKYFILKCGPRGQEFRTIAPVQETFAREIHIYSKVLAGFLTFQIDKRVSELFKSYPRFYISLEVCYEEMLILEDMKMSKFRQWPRSQVLDYNHVLLVIKEYAKLHALSFAVREQKPNLFKEMTNNATGCLMLRYSNQSFHEIGKHRISHALKALHLDNDKVIYNKLHKFSNIMFNTLTNLDSFVNPYAVISHIDCGIGNFLFKYEHSSQSRTPTEVCILDFQMSRLASPAVDLCTFIFSSTDKSLRKSFYNDLILEYYHCFCSFLKELGNDGNQLLSFLELQNQLKVYGIVGLYMAIHLLYVQTTINQNVPDIFTHGSKGFLYDLEDRTLFDVRVRDIIYDFDQLGYNFF